MDASSGTMYVWCIVVLDSKFYILEISQHKDRKESRGAFVPRAKVMIMGENSGDRGPLEPYPSFPLESF